MKSVSQFLFGFTSVSFCINIIIHSQQLFITSILPASVILVHGFHITTNMVPPTRNSPKPSHRNSPKNSPAPSSSLSSTKKMSPTSASALLASVQSAAAVNGGSNVNGDETLIVPKNVKVTKGSTQKLSRELTALTDDFYDNNDDEDEYSDGGSGRRRRRSGSTTNRPKRIKRNRSVSRATLPLSGPNNIPKMKESGVGSSVASAGTSDTDDEITLVLTSRHPTPNTRSSDLHHRDEVIIRSMQMKDISSVYELGNSIFTASEYPNMYRTWDDFAVIENFQSSAEFCFVAVVQNKNDEDEKSKGTTKTNEKMKNSGSRTALDALDDALDGVPKNDDDEYIIGFLLGETKTKSSVGTSGYIQWVAVEQSYRRLGIATTLVNQFCQVAGDNEKISLLLADTPEDNTPAINLFEKAGLRCKIDHVYLTKQLKKNMFTITNPDGSLQQQQHVDEDGYYDFNYNAKGNKIRIRPMEITDLYPIFKIGESIFTKESANLYNFWDEAVVMHHYLSDPDYCITATIKDEDNDNNVDGDTTTTNNNNNNNEIVIGFAFGTTIEKPRSSWKYGYLVWLGCKPEYQGLGVAYQLYQTMVELFALEKVRMLMIDTQRTNTNALNFFRKLGFGHDEEHVYLSNAAVPVPVPAVPSTKENYVRNIT